MSNIYKCPNIGNCDKADTGELITIPKGVEPICPNQDCNSKLIPTGKPPGDNIIEEIINKIKQQPIIIAGVLLLVVVVFGWFFNKTHHSTSATSFAGTTLLRFHGSNTIGSELLPALAEAFLQQEGYSNVRRIPGANEDECFIDGEKNGIQGRIEINAHGTKTAFEGLRSGLCDIGMASRAIKNEEWQALQPVLGDLRSNASEHVLALDGIAIIVHPTNSIKSLSLSQLADIFSGTITDWSEVEGQRGAINIFARDEKSGTWDFFNEAVLKKRGKTLSSKTSRMEDSRKLSASVSDDVNAIGFIGMNYIGSNKALALSNIGVEARKPTVLTVKTEDYILSRRLYLYTAEKDKNPIVSKFIEFALGTAGQKIVSSNYLVNLDPTPSALVDVDPHDARNKSQSWRDLTNGATEIETRFRFRKGSDALDTRANRDIGRIVGILSQPKFKDKKMLLIGFADSTGTASFNIELSQNRAEIIKRELAPEGIQFSNVIGLGAEAFVATNNSPESMEKNRRVEVWVT